MAKTKIALFDLTGCEGCEFHLLSLNELLLDIFQDFEITNWRLLSENQRKDFDIAFIEGAATTNEHVKLLKKIRETSKMVIALGSCAINGNIFAELDPERRQKLAPKIYDKNYQLKAKFLEPIGKFIKIDAIVPGCPPDLEKFKDLLKEIKGQKITSKIKSVLPPDYVAKIEGHGRLKINFSQKKAEFEIEESERLVEGLLLGKEFRHAPFINARICGICPIAHNVCSWKALENALDIKVSEETILLRELLLCAQIVKSHLLHLFFLVLPDFAHLKSSIELAKKYPAEFHLMLNIKRVSEKALKIIGGTTAFPINTTLGGFIKPPQGENLLKLRDSIYEVIDEAQDLIGLFAGFEVSTIESPVSFLTTNPSDGLYPLYQSQVTPKMKEVIQAHSTAKLALLPNGRVVKVGALSRMAKFSNLLNPKAKKARGQIQLDYKNPYHNNLAQAIEILHYLEEMEKLITRVSKMDLSKSRGVKKATITKPVQGEACLEAPRGILIHQVKLDKEGKIAAYNILPPTQINLASLEKEAQQLVQEKANHNQEKLEEEVEKLIRAFDPCITCAVH